MRARFPRSDSRLVVTGLALVLGLGSLPEARGQEIPYDNSSPARFIPRDNVIFYLEYRGLDSQAESWKKTAAYKILNETPAGSMLEDVATQLLEKQAAKAGGNPRQRAEQVVALIKHMARAGFVWAMLSSPNKSTVQPSVLVIRDAYKDKAIRAIMAENLRGLNAPNTQPQSVLRAGHKVVTGVDTGGNGFTWWVDDSKKEDIIRVIGKAEEADAILETVDGKRPSMREHPRRAELLKPDGKFVPTGLALVSLKTVEGGKNFLADYGYLGIGNVASVERAGGFKMRHWCPSLGSRPRDRERACSHSSTLRASTRRSSRRYPRMPAASASLPSICRGRSTASWASPPSSRPRPGSATSPPS